jgi:ferredoxin
MTGTAFAALPVSSRVAVVRQHLIDPEVCIRCNTCEETCPHGGIVHNDDNYAVLSDACTGCGKCLDPCPTGAIANWRDVSSPYSVDEQFSWSQLPAQQAGLAIDFADAVAPRRIFPIHDVHLSTPPVEFDLMNPFVADRWNLGQRRNHRLHDWFFRSTPRM